MSESHRTGRLLAAMFVAGAALPGLVAVLLARSLFFPTAFYDWGLSELGLVIVLVSGLALMLAGLAVGPIRAVRARRWKPATQSLLFALGMAAGLAPANMAGSKVRVWGLEQFARRSDAVTTAIQTYERDIGSPPAKLELLVPDYIAQVPQTGLPAFPEYRYSAQSGPCSRESSWHLAVATAERLPKECMVFCPDKDSQVWFRFSEIVSGWAVIDLRLEMPGGARVRLPYCF